MSAARTLPLYLLIFDLTAACHSRPCDGAAAPLSLLLARLPFEARCITKLAGAWAANIVALKPSFELFLELLDRLEEAFERFVLSLAAPSPLGRAERRLLAIILVRHFFLGNSVDGLVVGGALRRRGTTRRATAAHESRLLEVRGGGGAAGSERVDGGSSEALRDDSSFHAV